MSQDNEKRANMGQRAGQIGVAVNLLLALGKLAVGLISSSMSIVADAVNNFSDGVSSVVTLIGFRLAKKPADEDHPYGHARFEYISSLIVSIFIIVVGFELAKGSVEKIFAPTAINFSLLTAVILALSVAVKLALYIYNSRMARKIDSVTLKATAADCRNDAVITSVILAVSITEHFAKVKIDGFAGLAVALFILINGIMLVRETSSPILGKKNDSRLRGLILDKIKEYPIVIGYHDLMIHDYGPGISFCSVHLEIDRRLDPLYVHEVIDRFEREFNAYGTVLTVHYDPVVTDDPELNELKHTVIAVLVDRDNRLSIHDFRSIPCDGFTKLFFDLSLPEELAGREKEIKYMIDARLESLYPGRYQTEITFDSDAFN